MKTDNNSKSNFIEQKFERLLFAGRWFLAPFYLGLLIAILMLVAKFIQELVHAIPRIFSSTEQEVVLSALLLVDIALVGNLLIMVTFVGYDHFVSRLEIVKSQDRPSWLRVTDYHGLKLRALGSITVISAIQVLRMLIDIENQSYQDVQWMLLIMLSVASSGVLLAAMDRIAHPNGRENSVMAAKEGHQ